MTDGILDGLDDRCTVCGEVVGEHTLRQFNVCTGEKAWELPADVVPDDIAKLANERLREQFRLEGDWLVADTVSVKALVLSGGAVGLRVNVPAVLHEFQMGVAGRPPGTVAKVLFIGGTEDVMRSYGRLVRDSANQACNAAKRAAGGERGRPYSG